MAFGACLQAVVWCLWGSDIEDEQRTRGTTMTTCTFVWNTALAWAFTVAAVACAVADFVVDFGPLGRAGIMLAALAGCIHIRGWIARLYEREVRAFELGRSLGHSSIRSVN